MIAEGHVYTNNRGSDVRIDKIVDGRVHYTMLKHVQRGRIGKKFSMLIRVFMSWKRGGPITVDPLWEWVRSTGETKRPIRNLVLPGVGRSFPAVEVRREGQHLKLIVHRADRMIETIWFDAGGARKKKQITVPEGHVESQL